MTNDLESRSPWHRRRHQAQHKEYAGESAYLAQVATGFEPRCRAIWRHFYDSRAEAKTIDIGIRLPERFKQSTHRRAGHTDAGIDEADFSARFFTPTADQYTAAG